MGNKCFWCKTALAAIGAILVGLAAWYGGAFLTWVSVMKWLAGKIILALGLEVSATVLGSAIGYVLITFLAYLTFKGIEFVLCKICEYLGFCQNCQSPLT
jgi:hypothetical protein